MFSSNCLFGLEFDYVPNNFQYFAEVDATINCSSQFNSADFLSSVSFGADTSVLKSKFSLCAGHDDFDITLNAVYAPFFTDYNFNLGINSYFHTEFCFKTYTDLDLLFGLYFSKQFTKLFYFESSVFYMHKGSQIKAIKKDIPWLNTNTMAVQLDFDFTINDDINCGFILSSFDRYKFTSFISPYWTLYGNYNINDSLSAGMEVEFSYIDQFTISGNLHSVGFTSYLVWYF